MTWSPPLTLAHHTIWNFADVQSVDESVFFSKPDTQDVGGTEDNLRGMTNPGYGWVQMRKEQPDALCEERTAIGPSTPLTHRPVKLHPMHC